MTRSIYGRKANAFASDLAYALIKTAGIFNSVTISCINVQFAIHATQRLWVRVCRLNYGRGKVVAESPSVVSAALVAFTASALYQCHERRRNSRNTGDSG